MQKIFDTKTKNKKMFIPIKARHVGMYVCGPTVYDFLHIGNYRGAIFFNFVRNFFIHLGYSVNYVYNYTDVDDKIINRARDLKIHWQELTEKYINEFEKDYAALGLTPPTHTPRCSDYITHMVDFIKKLQLKGHAYVTDFGVYFDVKSFSKYGELSNKSIDEMQVGYRIKEDSQKKHACDFALWKLSKPDEPSWPSPWGEGRPGWHIECSVMSKELLGDRLDIHGGGIDLCFPHHENEKAQSECCSGSRFVNFWMHNNMLNFEDAKMSKSLGNTLKGRAFIKQHGGELLKYMILSHHYRSPIDFSKNKILLAKQALFKFYSSLALAQKMTQKHPLATGRAAGKAMEFGFFKNLNSKIQDALLDDFNTSKAFAYFFEGVAEFNKKVRQGGHILWGEKEAALAAQYWQWLKTHGHSMALFQEDPLEFLRNLQQSFLQDKNIQIKDVDRLVEARSKARAEKNYTLADDVRNQLLKLGIAVQDLGSGGSYWELDKSAFGLDEAL